MNSTATAGARSISVFMSVTLDGVVQGLGRPDEDTRGGFPHGGWGQDYTDEVMAREAAKGMARPGEMLFGHRTWRDFIKAWGTRTDDNPFTAHMNRATKYVASRTLHDAGEWENSVLLRGEATQTSLSSRPSRDRTCRSSVAHRWSGHYTRPA